MKTRYCLIAIGLTLLVACSHFPSSSSSAEHLHLVTRDYATAGEAAGIRPFVQDGHTMIKLDNKNTPITSITDANGKAIHFSQENGYYMLENIEESFSVDAGNTVRFELVQPIMRAENKQTIEQASLTPIEMIPENLSGQDPDAATEALKVKMNSPIFVLMDQQLSYQQKLLDRENANPNYSGAELFDIQSHLDFIAAKKAQETAVVHVYFPSGSTAFIPGASMRNLLVPAAKQAKKINLYGRTDSKVADEINDAIARGRAQSVRDFLVKHGVPANKIVVSSLAAGNFIAPSGSEEGRALNRRVTLELLVQ